MANTLTIAALSAFTSPVIRSLKWAANASLTRLETTPPSEKAMAAALAFPTRPLGKVKDGTGAQKAVSAFCAMLTDRGITPPPSHTIAPSTILGAFGVTDLSTESLRATAEVCKQALEARRTSAKDAPKAGAASVGNVLGTEAAKAPKADKPAAPEKITACKCGEKGEWTQAAPFCAACGCKVWKARPGRKPAAQTAAASVANVVG